MDKYNFENKVREMAEKKPKLFALESDNKADFEMIRAVEEYYNVKFPDCYKDFVNRYGGGYFGHIVVYSCDCNGMFYMKDNVLREWVWERAFLPVIDFETGDLFGFQIKDGVCRNTVSLYSHEEDELQELQMDFYDVLLKYGLNAIN